MSAGFIWSAGIWLSITTIHVIKTPKVSLSVTKRIQVSPTKMLCI